MSPTISIEADKVCIEGAEVRRKPLMPKLKLRYSLLKWLVALFVTGVVSLALYIDKYGIFIVIGGTLAAIFFLLLSFPFLFLVTIVIGYFTKPTINLDFYDTSNTILIARRGYKSMVLEKSMISLSILPNKKQPQTHKAFILRLQAFQYDLALTYAGNPKHLEQKANAIRQALNLPYQSAQLISQ